MMKLKLLFSCLVLNLCAAPFGNLAHEPKIAVQNAILAQVNGKTISMLDAKKKMDMIFYQTYPHLADSDQARFQFYEASWKRVVMDLIDHELIISDALDKEIKLTDGEIREAMEERFGPNVMQTLDKIGLTYQETWDMLKNELIVQRMSWWFIHSKAISKVTPQDIRQAYRMYLDENPPYSEWQYRVISIRADQASDSLSETAYKIVSESGKSPEEAVELLHNLKAGGASISLSNEFKTKTHDLSDLHRISLEGLAPGHYSKPSFQIGRGDKKAVYRIFYLVSKTDFPAPAFEDLSQELRNQLIQQAVAQESDHYLTKLRRHYGFDSHKTIPDGYHPFALQ